MKKLLLAASVILAGSHNAMAQDMDATDLTNYEFFEDGETIKTLAQLQDMKGAYEALVADGNCRAAIPAIIAFYEAANQVSNLIRRGNEPYYDASRDDRERITIFSRVPESAPEAHNLANELRAAEGAFNSLLRQRNRAWVEEAKCLLNEGEREAAILRLYRALDYISVDVGITTTGGDITTNPLWAEARRLLWAEVGFEPEL
ncbi:MAG: hypothetical protein GDA52_04420 [Rhodobacteraceae bacterium]|nr:hypothetical protein [Paracoccaceae bacterium]